jgi:hypothetical protein
MPLIAVGQKAKVQIKPFPKGEYRLFSATVETVGAELKTTEFPSNPTMTDKLKGMATASSLLTNPLALNSMKESYFPVILTIEKPYTMMLYGNRYQIKPGFSGEAKIITRQERIITFLARRVLRIKGEIVTEKIHL